jgi:hypothetical protein
MKRRKISGGRRRGTRRKFLREILSPYALLFALLGVDEGHCRAADGPRGGRTTLVGGSMARFEPQRRRWTPPYGGEECRFRILRGKRKSFLGSGQAYGCRRSAASGHSCARNASWGPRPFGGEAVLLARVPGLVRAPFAYGSPASVSSPGTPRIAPLLFLGILLRGGDVPGAGVWRA